MKRAVIQFAVTVVLLGFALVLYFFNQGAGLIAGMLVLPFLFMAWVDLGRSLRRDGSRNIGYVLGVVVGLPQALIGVGAIVCGLLFAVTYLWPGSTAPTTWWMAALSPFLILFGAVWIRDVLRKHQRDGQSTSA